MTQNKVTLITGTRKGIGRTLAEHFVKQGHMVVGCSRSPIDFELPNYKHILADVADEKAVSGIFTFIRKEFGRLDNLINNAGIASMNHSLLTPLSTVEKVLSTNFVGTFLFCREAAKLMRRNKVGRIVNFTTVAVPLRLDGESVYASSKAAVGTLTEILAKELGSFGITVNAIGPTPIDTDLIRAVPKEKINDLLLKQSIQRMGTVDDVINVIDFFLSDRSSFITGQKIYLGGVS